MSSLDQLTRSGALKTWREFLLKVGEYAGHRNHVIEGHANVSRLSPAIRYRLLLEVMRRALKPSSFRMWRKRVCGRVTKHRRLLERHLKGPVNEE